MMSPSFLKPNKIQLVYQRFTPLSFKPSISPYLSDSILLFSHGFKRREEGCRGICLVSEKCLFKRYVYIIGRLWWNMPTLPYFFAIKRELFYKEITALDNWLVFKSLLLFLICYICCVLYNCTLYLPHNYIHCMCMNTVHIQTHTL